MADEIDGGRITRQEEAAGVAEAAVATAKDAAEAARGYLEQAKEYAAEGYEAIADKAGEMKDSTEGLIKKNPWIAVGVALGVGVVIGMLIKGATSRD